MHVLNYRVTPFRLIDKQYTMIKELSIKNNNVNVYIIPLVLHNYIYFSYHHGMIIYIYLSC